ncbi:MAG TPA: glycosyl hydrolase family 18 protein [Streptosporangiaceae bacterium]|jgi:spore germination protein YaaH|nr:glycosyl hydrolase family 18 protein [Streptosporangiaceae bacterium]
MVNLGSSAPRHTLVVASMPYWNISHGTTAVLGHRKDVTEVSPWMYGLSSSGQIDTQYAPGQAASVADEIGRLRAAGQRIVPSIANITGGKWSYAPVGRMLHSPQLMAAQVAAIVALVQRHHYAGIDLDYEDLQAGDRQVFTTFVTRLAHALHGQGKVLSVAVFAKTTNAGTDPRNVAQDYAAIGRAADQVRLMAYDYHWETSPPGPVAPISWVRAVLRYAKTQIPASKIILGVPLYGYDWVGDHGSGISWLQALRLSRQYHASPHYDRASQTPWFRYRDPAGHEHTVWFENAASSRAKFDAAQGAQIGGVYLWMYGYEDAGTWSALGHVLPTSGAHALSTSRAVP